MMLLRTFLPIPVRESPDRLAVLYTAGKCRFILEYILWYMETYSNYHVILLDKPLLDIMTVYA